METCISSWKQEHNSSRFWLKWVSKKWRLIDMLKVHSGILMLFSNLKPILQEMLMTLSLFLILNLQLLKINSTLKQSRILMKKEDSEVEVMITNGSQKKHTKISWELIQLLFLQDILNKSLIKSHSAQENSSQLIESSEMKLWIILILLNFIKLKVLLLIEI